MAEIKINGRMTVKELRDQFFSTFEGVLRVYNGRSAAADDVTLASISTNSCGEDKEVICKGSQTAGDFAGEMMDILGVRIKVATKDDWVAVLDNIALLQIKDIPAKATREHMEKVLAAASQQAPQPEPASTNAKESSKGSDSQAPLEEMDIESMNLEQILRASKEWDPDVFNTKLNSLLKELYKLYDYGRYDDEDREKLLERSKSKKSQIDLMYYGMCLAADVRDEYAKKGGEVLKQLVDEGFTPAAYRLAEYHYRVYNDDVIATDLAYAIGWLSIYLQYVKNGGVILDAYLRREENKGHAEELFQNTYVKSVEDLYEYIDSLHTVYWDAEGEGEEFDTLDLWEENEGKEWPANYLDADKLKLLLDKYLELQQENLQLQETLEETKAELDTEVSNNKELQRELDSEVRKNKELSDKHDLLEKDYNEAVANAMKYAVENEALKAKASSSTTASSEMVSKYNQLVKEYNELLNKSKASYYALAAENEALRKNASSSSDVKSEVVSKYNQLVAKYNELCDAYEKLEAKNETLSNALASQQAASSSRTSQSDMVNVKICYGYVDDRGRKSSNWVKRVEMPRDEYKALLNGSMKAREAYVQKWLSYYQRAVDVSISLDN